MTHHISAMLASHPQGAGTVEKDKLAECIAACFECAQALHSLRGRLPGRGDGD